jgi:chemotaxis protein methyltransferase CheR
LEVVKHPARSEPGKTHRPGEVLKGSMESGQVNLTRNSTNYLSSEDLQRFGQLLLEKYGLNFSENRRSELEAAAIQSFAASTFSRIEDYLQFLGSESDGGAELERLVNIATVNETHFFRDSGQFEALATHVLPELVKRRQSMRTLRLWSAGCSSGEEPYSLAILLHELLPDVNEWSITILGTDVNTNALDRARRAVFSAWSFREELSKRLRDKYFIPYGNRWELKPEIRRMVTFSRMNLVTPNYPDYETNTNFIDLILCRNVLIYLGEKVAREIINRFFECLQPGGWLVVAPAEGSQEMFKRYRMRSFPSAILYQRMTQTAILRQEKVRLRVPTGSLKPLGGRTQPLEQAEPLTAPRPSPPQGLSPAEEQNLYEQAQDLIAYGHPDQALDILQKLTGSKTIRDKVCVLLAQINANRGNWDQAENWCLQAIRQNRLLLDAYYTLSLVLQHKDNLEHAIEAMRKVVYLDHSDVLGHFGLANLFFESAQFSKAIKSLDNALRLLDNRSPDELIPRSGGITVSRLRDAIIRQQQQWNGLALGQAFFG